MQESVTIEWSDGLGKKLYQFVNPRKVYDEICEIGERATPQQIVDRARDENSELHKCFTWDDTKAAEKWRKEEAHQLRHFLVVKRNDAPADAPKIHAFYFTGAQEGYVSAPKTFTVPAEYDALLNRAKMELRAFQKKYEMLSNELDEVMDAISRLT